MGAVTSRVFPDLGDEVEDPLCGCKAVSPWTRHTLLRGPTACVLPAGKNECHRAHQRHRVRDSQPLSGPLSPAGASPISVHEIPALWSRFPTPVPSQILLPTLGPRLTPCHSSPSDACHPPGVCFPAQALALPAKLFAAPYWPSAPIGEDEASVRISAGVGQCLLSPMPPGTGGCWEACG